MYFLTTDWSIGDRLDTAAPYTTQYLKMLKLFVALLLVAPVPIIEVFSRHFDKKPYRPEKNNHLWHTHDPEINMNTSDLIRYHGYPVEDHSVTTEDGFMLGIQRIPRGKHMAVGRKRPVVLLQHGFLSCSACWVENLPDQSLGFILADVGMDVWLGNNRGNLYSLRHLKYDSSQREFWNWTWDEMARYDLPATINYIQNTTGVQQIFYVGHGQGAEIAMAAFSENQEIGSKIKLFFALAPIAYMGHTWSPLRALVPFMKNLTNEFKKYGIYDVLQSPLLNQLLAQVLCDGSVSSFICESVLFFIYGFDYSNMNTSRIPVYVAHTPSGTSTKNLLHYLQAIKSKQFQKYDHGSEVNSEFYHQTSPPQYHLDKMSVPVALFYGERDFLVSREDYRRFRSDGVQHILYEALIPDWEHMDFVWGLNAKEMIYNNIIRMILGSKT